MNELKKILKKQGGLHLIKNYIKSGAFFTACIVFLLLGKKKKALEILRLSANFKLKNKLERIYRKDLLKFDEEYLKREKELSHVSSNKIWICWLQGMENAPYVVKICYNSLKQNLKDKEIIVLTKDNIEQYISFPDYILEKWKKGIITNTHFTDLLRLELLIKYGGLWVDATVLCTNNNIPYYFFESDLFFFQNLKPGLDGHSTVISSWIISAKTNNKVLLATRHLCYEYWKKNNYLIDYFLLHYFMTMVLEKYKEEWKKVIPFSNSTPHILLLRLFDKFDENIWNAAKEQTPFHKLTYKFEKEKETLNDTYYKKIVEEFRL